MSSSNGWSTIHVLFFCSVTYVVCLIFSGLGTVGKLNLASMGITPTLSQLPASLSTTNGEIDQKDPFMMKLEEYMIDLVDSTIGMATLREVDFENEDLKGLFHLSLLQALEKHHGVNCTKVGSQNIPLASKLGENKGVSRTYQRIPPTTKFLHGVVNVDVKDFLSVIDTGVPVRFKGRPSNNAVILYSSPKTLPTNIDVATAAVDATWESPAVAASEAIENCGQLSVIHVRDPPKRNQCLALIPGPESFLVQRWLRAEQKLHTEVNMSLPFRLVSRKFPEETGLPKSEREDVEHRKWLGEYFLHVDSMIAELRPIVEKIAIDKQVVVTVVNLGQFDLLVNFACFARSRGISINHVLVLVTDKDMVGLVEDLGMAAYYNEEFLGSIPSGSGSYGDRNFGRVVVGKLIGPHLLTTMGYSYLFQDVDVLWYKDPLRFFNKNNTLINDSVDMYFQDDYNQIIYFQPFSGNSGCYYLRHNDRTRRVIKDIIMKTDVVKVLRSDQETLNGAVIDAVSSYGLRVKVFSAFDTEYFPSGSRFHSDKEFMKALMRNETDAYVFHMNWTVDKKEKLAYLQQIGAWFVNDQCMERSPKESVDVGNFTSTCCAAQPLIKCTYRDKPSIIPCNSSPAKGKEDAPSWWD